MSNGCIVIQIQRLMYIGLGICFGIILQSVFIMIEVIMIEAIEIPNTIRTYEKRCTLDSLNNYNITFHGVCPIDQITIENWDSINPLDKQAIDFILSSNGYELESENIINEEIINAKPTENITNQTR